MSIMRHLRYIIALIVILALPYVAPNDFFIHLSTDIAIIAIAAIGLNILLGLSGQLSLGQAGFFALSAYGSGVLATKHGWPLWASLPVGLMLAGLAGVLLGLVALRARTHYLAMVTLAFGYIVEILAQRWVDLTGGSMGLIGVPQLNFGDFRNGATYFLWAVGITLLLVQMVNDYIMQSRIGRNLHAIKESESFALTVGINAALWRAGIFVFAALLAGLAGFFFVHQSGYISSDAFGLDRSISLLIAVVIGGLGHPYGGVVGALILVLLNQLTAGLYEISYFIFGGILLGVMLFFPGGATGAFESLRKRLLPKRGAAPAQSGEAELPRIEAANNAGPILELRNVTKSYAGLVAVNDVSIQVMPGSVHALIGPNGAGKSTLINVIAGLYAANKGSILYRGTDVTSLPAHRRAAHGLTRTFQNLQLIGTLSVAENVMLGLRRRQGMVTGWLRWLVSGEEARAERAEALRLLAFFGIERFADSLPGDLAYGHRKLCELARALAQQPTLLLLDEPIAGLNEGEMIEIMAVIRRLKSLGVTILLVEHNMTFVMGVSDRVSVLDYGRKIGEGTPAEVQRNEAVITAYLGQEA